MARYKDAIDWMVCNDDTQWVNGTSMMQEEGDALSVTAALVADLFNKDDETIRADLKRALNRKCVKR